MQRLEVSGAVNKTSTMEGAKIRIGNKEQPPKVKEIAFRRIQGTTTLPATEHNLTHRQHSERQIKPTS